MIEVLIVVAIIGILSSFLVPNLIRAHYKGRASRIANDLRTFRDTFLQYKMEKETWPRSRSWGRVPPEFISSLPPGADFDIPGWDVSYAYTNYRYRSNNWVSNRGYSVILRARIRNVMLANTLYKLAPNLFFRVLINKRRGMFYVVLE